MNNQARRMIDGPSTATTRLILAHGAGAGMDTPWMNDLTARLIDLGLQVTRFEFPYMQRRRLEGSRRPPDRMPVLEKSYRDEVAGSRSPGQRLLIGGKSMGGRVASRLADALQVDGLVCLGYPFHPPAKPESLRTEHLEKLATRTLIFQGERDPFGTPEEVDGYALAPTIQVHWLADGDHSLKPRKRSGHTLEQHLDTVAQMIAAF